MKPNEYLRGVVSDQKLGNLWVNLNSIWVKIIILPNLY